jgi:hypothetical protein
MSVPDRIHINIVYTQIDQINSVTHVKKRSTHTHKDVDKIQIYENMHTFRYTKTYKHSAYTDRSNTYKHSQINIVLTQIDRIDSVTRVKKSTHTQAWINIQIYENDIMQHFDI